MAPNDKVAVLDPGGGQGKVGSGGVGTGRVSAPGAARLVAAGVYPKANSQYVKA